MLFIESQTKFYKGLKKLKNNPEIGTATKAVEILARGLDYKERSVWKILSRAKHS
jgi:hypothetical protein